MPFDLCKHKLNMVLIRCGQELVKVGVLPQENDVAKLANMTGKLLGVMPETLTSKDANHLPRPDETGPFFKCPKCGEEKMVIFDICSGCKKSEGGKFKTELKCSCGYEEITEKFRTQLYKEFNYDFKSGMKVDLGIYTITDSGLE